MKSWINESYHKHRVPQAMIIIYKCSGIEVDEWDDKKFEEVVFGNLQKNSFVYWYWVLWENSTGSFLYQESFKWSNQPLTYLFQTAVVSTWLVSSKSRIWMSESENSTSIVWDELRSGLAIVPWRLYRERRKFVRLLSAVIGRSPLNSTLTIHKQ